MSGCNKIMPAGEQGLQLAAIRRAAIVNILGLLFAA
jgi:hypothetical protein